MAIPSFFRAFQKGLLLLFLAWGVPLTPQAGSPPLKPRIQLYTADDYNGPDQVLSGLIDRSGLLHAGVRGGVLHFDGERWTVTLTEEGMSVFALKLDKKGRIWVGGRGAFGYLKPSREQGSTSSKGKEAPPRGRYKYVSLMDRVPDSAKDFKNV
ncbi:MAG: hypothetical protein ABEH38_07025, partial [Flavobacteriales bacterium]